MNHEVRRGGRAIAFASLLACGHEKEFDPPPISVPAIPPQPPKYAGVCPREPPGTEAPPMTFTPDEALERAKELDGKSIRVCGWIHLAFEETCLLRSPAAYANRDNENPKSPLYVNWLPESRACEGRYVCVDGAIEVPPPDVIGCGLQLVPHDVFDHSD